MKQERQPVVVEHRPAGSGAVVPLRESSVLSLARTGSLSSRQVDAAFRVANLVRAAAADAGHRFAEYVDGGEAVPLAERATDAMRELRRVRQLLGKHGYVLVVSICADGRSLVDGEMGYATRRQRDTAADVLRLHLSELADLWRIER